MDNNELVLQKEKEYTEYIKEHVANVQKAMEEIIKKCSSLVIVKNNIDVLRERAKVHDESKYSDEEFYAYRKHFYPINEEEKESSEDEFNKAWEHHYAVNTHHWNHWYNKETGVAEEMPLVDIIEMVADWMAMGYKFNSSAPEWYETNKKDIHLSKETESTLLELLNLIK